MLPAFTRSSLSLKISSFICFSRKSVILNMTSCSASTSSSVKTAIVLFRNDLRVHDNEALHLANQNCTHVLPLYCFDPCHFQKTYHFGFPKTGCHRAKFLLESVHELKENLVSRGSNLVVRLGKPEDVIPELVKTLNLGPNTMITMQKEVTDEEITVEKKIKAKSGLAVHFIWGHTLYHMDDLPFQIANLPDVYTQFRKRVDGIIPVKNCFNIPDKLQSLPPGTEIGNIPTYEDLGLQGPEKDSRTAFPFNGGETSALTRLHDYLWVSDNVSTYKETRNGMIGAEYSTKFSPWLGHGCLSPRKIFWEVKKYERERTANQSTYWVIFELIWRDYFRHVALKYGNKLFFPSGIKGGNVHWKTNKLQFEAWKEGRTGVPYVDANMREVAATGFMSNRGRQNVASFLTKDLELDWRLGAEWFESMLIDHDVCSNYGNWLYSAGIGNDPCENRKFNVVKQGLDYDAQGDYVRLWVPELSSVKSGKVHCVWTLNDAALRSADVALGQTYPHPIVIAPEWGRHFGRPTSGSASGFSGGQHKRGRQNHQNQQQSAGQKRGIDFYFSSKNPR